MAQILRATTMLSISKCTLEYLSGQVSPNHISKRLASNNRLITIAGIEPLSPVPSRSLTFSNYSFPTKRTIKNMPINKLLICTKFYSIFLDTIRLPCSLIDYAQSKLFFEFFVLQSEALWALTLPSWAKHVLHICR